jgi:4-hydroxybenzoate polyprenyltransferase
MSEAIPRTGGNGNVPTFRDCFAAMRPNQWTKNTIVLAAFFFAFWDTAQQVEAIDGLTLALPAMLLFCIVSSGIYILNDLRDVAADQAHPVKCRRPIAAGRVPQSYALGLALVLLLAGIAGSYLLSSAFAATVVIYVAIQVIYSFGLKNIALLDVFVIATGFVLRAIAGARVLDVRISYWLLLCTFVLALFLALCKRRHEKLFVDDSSSEGRASLEQYDRRLLDLLIAISASSTIVCYAMYTLAAETVAKFSTEKLAYTVPFVIFGVFRYLDLAYRHRKGDRPEKILLTDVPILVNLALYGLSVIIICLQRR